MAEVKSFLQQIWHLSNFIWPCWLTTLRCVSGAKLHKLFLKKKKRSKLNQKHDFFHKIQPHWMHSSCAWHEIDLHNLASFFFFFYEKGLLTEPIIPECEYPNSECMWLHIHDTQLPLGMPWFLSLWFQHSGVCMWRLTFKASVPRNNKLYIRRCIVIQWDK